MRSGAYRALDKRYYTSPGARSDNSSAFEYGNTVDKSGSNLWLTPLYVMLFDFQACGRNCTASYPPSGMDASLRLSTWYRRYTAIDGVLTIVLPRTLPVTHIKIQRSGVGSLSLAEMEVYPQRLNLLQSYAEGSPVISNPLLPFQPVVPFRSAFQYTPVDGLWYLSMLLNSSLSQPLPAGKGAVGEIVLLVTDFAGLVHPYYQEISAAVTSLPRFGSIFVSQTGTHEQFLSYPDALLPNWAQLLIAQPARTRYLGRCYVSSTNNTRLVDGYTVRDVLQPVQSRSEDMVGRCLDTFGQGPQLSQSAMGDEPTLTLLRQQRVVYYLPHPDFIGEDSFGYSVYAGTHEQSYSAHVNVQRCQHSIELSSEDSSNQTSAYLLNASHPLCTCLPSGQQLFGDSALCAASIRQLCFQDIYTHHFSSLCNACFATDSNSTIVDSTDCRLWTLRSVAALQLQPRCALRYQNSNEFRQTRLSTLDFVLSSLATGYEFQANADSLGRNVCARLCLKAQGITQLAQEVLATIHVNEQHLERFVPQQTAFTNHLLLSKLRGK